MNNNVHLSGNKKAPVNLYYTSLRPILTTHSNNRNFSGRTYSNINNIIRKSKKWNLSEMRDIKKKLNVAVRKRITFIKNKKTNKIISTINHIQINNINTGRINQRFNLNYTVGNKVLTSQKNSKKKLSYNSNNISNKENSIKKKINFSNISNNSFKINQPNKKIIKNKIKNTIPFNIHKLNINIINNNNININII